MKQLKKYSLSVLLCCLLIKPGKAVAQTVPEISDAASLLAEQFTGPVYYRLDWPHFSKRNSIIERSPAEGDTAILDAAKGLLRKGPDHLNYETYADLAAVYWRAGNNAMARKIALQVERSRELYYTGTLFHSANNIYEYGSFTSSFKNEACLLLCKIYIEEKKYHKALEYLIKADKQYEIHYNCGTGNMLYRQKITDLYFVCYEGLGYTDYMVNMYFRADFYNNEELVALLKKKYTDSEIRRLLALAVDNITLLKDNWVSEQYTHSDFSGEDSLVSRYTSGDAYTVLFHRKVQLPRPWELKNGEVITRQYVKDAFTRSLFYRRLMGLKEEDSPAEESSDDISE